MIQLKSLRTQKTVWGETDHVRERAPDEVVHRRIDDDHPRCIHCGAETGPLVPWTTSKRLYSNHALRCS
jgi:hypothetical protein